MLPAPSGRTCPSYTTFAESWKGPELGIMGTCWWYRNPGWRLAFGGQSYEPLEIVEHGVRAAGGLAGHAWVAWSTIGPGRGYRQGRKDRRCFGDRVGEGGAGYRPDLRGRCYRGQHGQGSLRPQQPGDGQAARRLE